MNCQSTVNVTRIPSCDHDSDPVDRAIYILADNLLKHFQTAKHWDCADSCWLEAVTEARAILDEWKAAP